MNNKYDKEALAIMQKAYDDLYTELDNNFSMGQQSFETDFAIEKHRILAAIECGLQMIRMRLNEYSALIDKEKDKNGR